MRFVGVRFFSMRFFSVSFLGMRFFSVSFVSMRFFGVSFLSNNCSSRCMRCSIVTFSVCGHSITMTLGRVRRVVRIKADEQEHQTH